MNWKKSKEAETLLKFLLKRGLESKVYRQLEKRPMRVIEVYIAVRCEWRSQVSAVLLKGKKLGVYNVERKGKTATYSINWDKIKTVKTAINNFKAISTPSNELKIKN